MSHHPETVQEEYERIMQNMPKKLDTIESDRSKEQRDLTPYLQKMNSVVHESFSDSLSNEGMDINEDVFSCFNASLKGKTTYLNEEKSRKLYVEKDDLFYLLGDEHEEAIEIESLNSSFS